jgi:tetratricopeptide (TPR) repeat protein
MEPSYKQILDLFGMSVERPELPEHLQDRPKRLEGGNAQESVELGAQSLTEGDYGTAIRHFKRAIEQRDQGDPQGLVDLAGVYETMDEAPQALRQYEKALRIRKNQTEPYVGLSQLYKRQARYRESVRRLQEALELEPHNAFYHFKIAEIYRETGEREQALIAGQHAVAGAPTDSFYHYWVGDLLVEMHRYDEALDSLRAAIELSPGDDYLYLRAAAAFWGADRRQEAVKAIRLASDLDPEKDLYHGVLELFLSEMGLDEEADLEAARAARMDEYDREALRRFAAEIGLVA